MGGKWSLGLTKENSEIVRKRGLAISKALKGRKIPWAGKMAATKRAQHRPAWNRGLTKETDPRVAKYARSQAKHVRTPEHCRHIREAKLGVPNPKKSAEMRRSMQNPEFVRELLRRVNQRPNKVETRTLEILNRHFPGEWRYVGGGQFVLGGKVPDFMNVNGKKQLIEVYGMYFHRGQNPQKRIDYFRQFGFETLVLWEDEIKDEELVVSKVRNLKCVEAIQELPQKGKDMVRHSSKGGD
jgi:very-short-patch-repair endonuclease